MNEKSSANGIVTATISAVRTLNRKSAEHDEDRRCRGQVPLDRLRRLLNQLGAVVVRNDLDVRRQHAPVQRSVSSWTSSE